MKRSLMIKLKLILFASTAVTLLVGSVYAQTTRGTYTITADVPLRSGPGSNYEALTTLPKGIKINVVGKEGYCLKVESKHGGKAGYIDEQFASRDSATKSAQNKATTTSVAGPYRTLREVELRQGPGTKYPTVARIPADIKVNVVRAEGDWLRIESKKGGKPGYVDKRDVEPWRD
ncbi:MAG TPA: SH3 domain-containing protein [Acidobacteriota bacterium]|nr:SH3 domain-containing protein [Acidobacteriota bacterium]